MAGESITIYKLIILYTLSKVDSPLPQGIISDYIIDHGYTNYFNVQNAFGELLQAELIREDTTYHLAYYELTRTGLETLNLFGHKLSSEIRNEINDYLKTNQYEILNETALVSDYRLTPDGSYLATCTLKEKNQTVFQLSLAVSSEEDAIKICDNWREASEALYMDTMKQLLK
ncbi:MAG: DUF4364 family protein [Lachnospiraceae bacterium]|nr:DUF4364 family protein [Lachnospiraceae bacterium]